MQRESWNIFAVIAVAVAVAACGGGGGGAEGGVVPPPPPPPPPPYASNCVTTPTALSCGTSSLDMVVGVDGAFVNMPFEWLRIDRRGTMETGDDVYEWGSNAGASAFRKTYANIVRGNDGLGPIRTTTNVQRDLNGVFIPGDGSTLTLFDITNVLQGGLDYVQLGRQSSGAGGGSPGFFAVGRTVPLSFMPTTGSGRYDGGTRGAYTNASGTTYATASDVTFTANFATGAVTGSTSNFRMIDSSGAKVAPPYSLDFDFTAHIAGSSFRGTATSPTMTGSVDGAFHGERNPPAEASLGFSLREISGGGTLVGVGGLSRK